MTSVRTIKKDVVEIYPKFIVRKSNDLMIRGGDFYAAWIEERGLWSTDEDDVIAIIDNALTKHKEEYKKTYDGVIKVSYLWDAESGMIDRWHKFCQKQMSDSYKDLDGKLVFSNTKVGKRDYASKRLPYDLEEGPIDSYKELMSTIYNEEERHKIEWAIGSIVAGESVKIQKFVVLYGSAGTGKSTVLNLIEKLFEGYFSVFDAKALGSSNHDFALEAFKKNPLVAIQHDGDLSRIDDNTRLNSLVSHETMTVNEKFKATYAMKFRCFLFMGTNKPVKITDAKSGLIRRLIDISPSGNKLSIADYRRVVKGLDFELGAIAHYCQEVYMADPHYYDDYIPTTMLDASNDFYNFVLDSYLVFKNEDSTTLKSAWEMYKQYCTETNVMYPFSQRVFKEELKNYFKEYSERYTLEDGSRVRNYYSSFLVDKFKKTDKPTKISNEPSMLIQFKEQPSIFDEVCKECSAQLSTPDDKPQKKWDFVTTKLKDIDTSRVHYVRVPENHIVIDFDIPDENGEKSLERNLVEASKWPATYSELSKSGKGVHLHYIYTGDVSKLSSLYADNIEVKVFTGKSSLRRRLTKCNDLQIASINSGLPLKKEKLNMIDIKSVQSERGLREMIKKNLRKEYHDSTKPSVDFIHKILEDAYKSDLHYDVTDMRNMVLAFAANSTNQAEACLKLVSDMKWKSEEPSDSVELKDRPIAFYDVEVFPNLFLVNWKVQGPDKPMNRMINPSRSQLEILLNYNLVGYNCRRYDNHIIYAGLIGYTVDEIYKLSKAIIGKSPNVFFSEAYSLSYTDIYDFASAGNKMSLKKLQIKMGFHHQELGLPWDEPVPEEMWPKVSEYCDNDVLSTEAAFDYLKGDWMARLILSDLAEMTPNDTTNTLTTKIVFGNKNKNQPGMKYRNLGEPIKSMDDESMSFLKRVFPDMVEHWSTKDSVLPYFPGYKFESGKSYYRDELVGEGGYVYAEPGIWRNVALLDATSMHPHSAMAEVLFGPKFTQRFYEIVYGRVGIKHQSWDELNDILDGKLRPYIDKVKQGLIRVKDLSEALKTAINSVYGLTSASFDNAFKDTRNIDNIVAKRGALFMIDLKHAVQERGYTVAHVKTDSIKIPDATISIIDFVFEMGKHYGYFFEHEATYEKMCLVNNAVYIAKYATKEKCNELYNYVPKDIYDSEGTWTATGTQFAVPYVFKTLFSGEPVTFEDCREVKSVITALYLDMNEDLKEDEHNYVFVGRVGEFTPIKAGHGGGILLREKDGKYSAATGSKGYRWMESEKVKQLNREDFVDLDYYRSMVDKARAAISKFGDFEEFVA